MPVYIHLSNLVFTKSDIEQHYKGGLEAFRERFFWKDCNNQEDNEIFAIAAMNPDELPVDELKENVRRKETLIIAENAPFSKKDLLKQKKYRWSDGQGTLPKAWWTTLTNDELQTELDWLDTEIYGFSGAANALPKIEITARQRYSLRALSLE